MDWRWFGNLININIIKKNMVDACAARVCAWVEPVGFVRRVRRHSCHNPIFDLFILIILFTKKKWWKTSKNKINEEWIKIWVKGNMIESLKI